MKTPPDQEGRVSVKNASTNSMDKTYLVYYNMTNITMKIKDIDTSLIDFAELKKNPNIKTLKMSYKIQRKI